MDHAISVKSFAPSGRPQVGGLGALFRSFAWAVEVRRCCDRELAAGRRLDGDAIRRIVRNVDERLAGES